MTAKLIWDDAYLMGIEDIDLQHQGLFVIANMLETVKSEGQLKNILLQLYRHTREHFTAEERLMRESAYPDLLSHAKLHDELLESLMDTTELSFVNSHSILNLKQFVSKWLTDHIVSQDLAFATYLKNKNR